MLKLRFLKNVRNILYRNGATCRQNILNNYFIRKFNHFYTKMMRSKYIFSKLVQRQNVRYYSKKLKPKDRLATINGGNSKMQSTEKMVVYELDRLTGKFQMPAPLYTDYFNIDVVFFSWVEMQCTIADRGKMFFI